jgi:hypothetical protein
MKKIYLVMLATAATLMMASCVQDVTDNDNNGTKIEDENTISFVLTSDIETRSASAIQVNSYSLGDPVDGQHVYLEETVTYLDGSDAPAPDTKGTPVYTSNFLKMSGGSFNGLAYAASDMTTPVVPDGPISYIAEEGKWCRKFAENPFANQDEVYFFMRMPASPSGVEGLTYGVKSNGRCTIDFDYTLPLTATEQQDILFTGRPVEKGNGTRVPILFHHALTGIKFATAHDNSGDVKTYITKVEIPSTGLWGQAHFQITPSWEGGKYEDNPTTYSSAGAVKVSGGQQLGASTKFTQTFSESDVVDFPTNGSFTDNGSYPSSFAAAGSDTDHPANQGNLNDGNASKTFWLIPQGMNQNIVINISFYIVSGGKRSEEITRTLEIGKLLLQANENAAWKAGELRTFTLKTNEVDVVIEDEVEGLVKDEVTITNVGNAPEYVRAQIVGYWMGKAAGGEEGLALGYISNETNSDGDYTNFNHVTPWALLAPDASGKITGDTNGGTFTGLPGTDWILGKDGFFYYTQLVQPGAETAALFNSFTCTSTIPTIYYETALGERIAFTDVHLAVDIPVQAVEAKLVEGTYQDYQTAWAAAGVTGITE